MDGAFGTAGEATTTGMNHYPQCQTVKHQSTPHRPSRAGHASASRAWELRGVGEGPRLNGIIQSCCCTDAGVKGAAHARTPRNPPRPPNSVVSPPSSVATRWRRGPARLTSGWRRRRRCCRRSSVPGRGARGSRCALLQAGCCSRLPLAAAGAAVCSATACCTCCLSCLWPLACAHPTEGPLASQRNRPQIRVRWCQIQTDGLRTNTRLTSGILLFTVIWGGQGVEIAGA
jgi:hypothetical protein